MVGLQSQWCFDKRDEMMEAENFDSALDYQTMGEMWLKREAETPTFKEGPCS